MSNIAVIYRSKYGTTKRYAAWIAEELGAELLERSAADPDKLADYDLVIYGGGLYGGGIGGVDLVTKHPCKRLAVFTVGLADPAATDFTEIIERNIPASLRGSVRVFHLRGGIDHKRLSVLHKGMMAMLKAMLSRKPEAERPKDAQVILDCYGGAKDFTDRAGIQPIVEYARAAAEAR